MVDTIYSFRTNNKDLLNKKLNYINDKLIPSYLAEGYKAKLLYTDHNAFGVLTNCPHIFNSDKLGDYSYTESWTQNGKQVDKKTYYFGNLILC